MASVVENSFLTLLIFLVSRRCLPATPNSAARRPVHLYGAETREFRALGLATADKEESAELHKT